MTGTDERPTRPHWGCVVAFVVPVLGVIGFLVWLFGRLTHFWSR